MLIDILYFLGTFYAENFNRDHRLRKALTADGEANKVFATLILSYYFV